MNKRKGIGVAVGLVLVVAGLFGFKLPEPVADMLRQAGVEVPAAVTQQGETNDGENSARAEGSSAQSVASASGSSPAPTGRENFARDFREAKRWLYDIHDDRRTDFYCGCGYDRSRRNIDTSSCGYKIQEDRTRGSRIEAEHVVPASWMGKSRACWDMPNCRDENGRQVYGRDCCLATDKDFRQAHNDLHNLMPTVGELNKHRGSYPFGDVRGEPREYGQCNFEVRDRGPVEPPDNVKGDIARIAFYMQERYDVDIRDRQMQTLRAWDRQDPVSDWERERNRRVAKKQGTSNRFVTNP